MLRTSAASLPKNLAWPHVLVAWIRKALAASRERRVASENLAYFRGLDPAVLEDIGLDIASLGKGELRVTDYNPYVISANVVSSKRRSLLPGRCN
jgi:hypothetical protein